MSDRITVTHTIGDTVVHEEFTGERITYQQWPDGRAKIMIWSDGRIVDEVAYRCGDRIRRERRLDLNDRKDPQ